MPELTTHKFEKQLCADTASGQSTLIDWQVPFPNRSGWYTGTTMSSSPKWTTRTIGEREVQPRTTVLLPEVSSGDRKVVFDKGLWLAVAVEYDGNLFVASDEQFGLYGSGKSQADAIADYSEFFVEFFSELKHTPNAELPLSTRRFKRTLLAFGKLIERD